MKIGYLPLDERPVNVRYPQMLAEIAQVELLLPPADLLSARRTPARCEALVEWIEAEGMAWDALVVSCEMLGYGSLIQSRISDEAADTIMQRLDVLRRLKRQKPSLMIYGFSLITRISRASDSGEEPDYWSEYGARMYRFSQLLDRAEQGQDVDAELARLRSELPNEHISDFLRRRLRNHTINLNVLELLAEGAFDLLVLSSDDTSAYGLGSREKRWLTEWAARLGVGERLLMYPGADEVGSVLVARAIHEREGTVPSFEVVYAVPEGAGVTAAFEDVAIKVTVERQIRALGGAVKGQDADILLVVNPPRASEMEWVQPYTSAEREARLPHLRRVNARMLEAVAAGRVVAAADTAHANGGDTEWVELLLRDGLIGQLDAYSGWNTAGNSIGTAVAQAGLAAQFGREQAGQKRLLAHRVIEDWAYQSVVREQINQWVEAQTGGSALPSELVKAAEQKIEAALDELIRERLGAMGVRLVPGSVYLPWGRTFEVDFELEPAAVAGAL